MQDIIEQAFEITTICVVSGIMNKTIKNISPVDYEEEKKSLKAPIRNLRERSFDFIIEQGFLDTVLVFNVATLARSTRFLTL